MRDIEELNKKVDDNTHRLDSLERHNISTDLKLDNLCEKLGSLIAVLKYVVVTFSGVILTLLIFLAEKHI